MACWWRGLGQVRLQAAGAGVAMAQGQPVASGPGRSPGVPLEPPHQTLPKDPASRHVPREGQASRCEFALTRPESRQQNPISPIPHRQLRPRQDRRARGIEGRLQAPQHRRSNVGHWRGRVERLAAKISCLQRFPSFLAGISNRHKTQWGPDLEPRVHVEAFDRSIAGRAALAVHVHGAPLARRGRALARTARLRTTHAPESASRASSGPAPVTDQSHRAPGPGDPQ